MAGSYKGAVRSITPSLTDDNWILSAGAGEVGRVIRVHGTGEATTSTAMQTRHARASGQSGALTAGNVGRSHPNDQAPLLSFGTTFATTQPTLDAGDLFAPSWNAHGGSFLWVATRPEEEWLVIGAATETLIVSRNSVGTAVSSYEAGWIE